MFVIKFKNGSYFQSLGTRTSGPLTTAKRFDTGDEAVQFLVKHEWILLDGGAVVEPVRTTPEARAQPRRDLGDITVGPGEIGIRASELDEPACVGTMRVRGGIGIDLD